MSIRTRFNPLGTIGRKELLPAGYIELEYLESTGSQYITVPHTFINHSKFAAKLDMQAVSNDFYGLMGFSGSAGQWFRVNSNRFEIGQTVYTTSVNPFIRGKITQQIDRVGTVYTANFQAGNESVRRQLLLNETPQSYGLFGTAIPYTALPGYHCGSIRLFSAEIRVDDVLKHRLIPALDPTGRPCMFDTVTQQPFYNKGTGEFLWRAKLPEGYTALEYIESVGARQYIDTGVVPNADYTIETDAMFINPMALSTVYWCRETSAPSIQYPSFGLLSANAPSGNMKLRVYHGVNGSSFSGIYDVNLQSGQRFSFEAKAGEFYVNDTKTTMSPPSSYTPVTTIGLFWMRQDGSWFKGSVPSTTSSVRVYSFKIKYNSGNMKQYLVPALDKTSKPCMFDLLTRKTLYNQGTGEFLYG